MRILQINSCHFRRGGADVVYLNTAEILKSKGNEVFFYSQQFPKNLSYEFSSFFTSRNDFRKDSLLKKLSSSSSFIYNKEAYYKLQTFLKVVKPEVAHIHLFLGSLSVSILKVLKEANVPIVVTVHDYRLLCPAYLFLDGKNEVCELCRDGFYARCVYKRCSLEHKFTHSIMLTLDAYFRKYYINPVDYIDHFIFVSHFSRNKHLQFDFAYKNKSSFLYNFNYSLAEKVNIKKGSYFLFFGRLSKEKGIETLISTIQYTNFQIKIVGNGPLLEQYKNLGFDNIQFEGYKDGKELMNIIQDSSFVIVPSECYENNPMSIVESFSLGKPVIGANIGGIPELITHAKNGYLFESRDSHSLLNIMKFASDITEQEYLNLSSSALKFAQENFNKETHYQSLISIYKNVIATKNSKQIDK